MRLPSGHAKTGSTDPTTPGSAPPAVPRRALSGAVAVAMGVVAMGCAGQIPAGKQGISRLTITGAEHMDPAAVRACLATRERERFGFAFGGQAAPVCGQPPFDDEAWNVDLWAWPWTEWPLLDPAILERDQERIERWYRARGYYDAVVRDAAVDAKDAEHATVRIHVEEGQPVQIASVEVAIAGEQPALQRRLQAVHGLTVGERFDEFYYDRAKRALQDALGEDGYAHARVTGAVRVDPASHRAAVTFRVQPGRPARFGRVFVRGHGDMPAEVIWAAAGIRAGEPFSVSALDDARQAVYGLGPFASVEVAPLVEPEEDIVHVLIRVVRGQETRFRVGAGMESGGSINTQQTDGSFAQWDIHLLARFEHRNFLGGMRRLQVEERPRLIFDGRFPDTTAPNLGNALSVDFRQPAFMEARTFLVANLRWDLGPDPFGGRFFRSDSNVGLGPERRFFGGALRLTSSVNWHQFRELPGIFQDLTGAQDGPFPDYDVFFMHHVGQLDLRDNPRAPSRGLYAQVSLLHAGYFLPGDFDYVRFIPDLRGYLPLPFGIVLAARAQIGLMHVASANVPRGTPTTLEALRDQGFIERLARFGPLRHRLRGGGHNSVRGYRPNELGDVVLVSGRLDSGGLRQWEGSLELRMPVTENLGAVLFADAGDVSRQQSFRLNHPQTTLGIGLRYRTLVGPLRLDMGFAPQSLQVFGRDSRVRAGLSQSKVFGLAPGAVHLTIGEAF